MPTVVLYQIRKTVIVTALLVAISILAFAATVYAIDTSSTFYTSNLTFQNLGINRTNFAAAHEISGASLIDDGFVTSDVLNGVVHQGAVLVPAMPPNNRILMNGAAIDDGGAFTDQTSEIISDASLDVALLPISPAVDDAIYFLCDNPCRILTLQIDQEGIGAYDLRWEYFNGTQFVTGSGVDDRTSNFKLAGRRTVSFDMPSNMATLAVTGTGTTAFVWRAVVDNLGESFPTPLLPQQPIAGQGHYENGQYWAWLPSLDINAQEQYQLSLGGPDLLSRHQIFTGTDGITTLDSSTIEPGSAYSLRYEGRLKLGADVATGSSVCLICKAGALRVFISDTDEITAIVTGAGTTTLVLDNITLPTTGSQVVRLRSDGSDLDLEVEGFGVSNGAVQTVTDTANSWEFSSNDSTVYIDKITFATPGTISRIDDEAEWDTGTFSNTESEAGQPATTDPNLNYLNEAITGCGTWIEGSSDFFQCGSGSVIQFGFDGGGARTAANAYMRFTNVQLDQGETVLSAAVEFVPTQTLATATVNINISAVNKDDANAPIDFADAEALPITGVVAWSAVPTFTADTPISSPDISAVIQAIVDRPGFERGNAIVLFFEDDGSTAVAGTRRISGGVISHQSAPRLEITTSVAPTLPADFVELTDNAVPQDWTQFCVGCTGSSTTDVQRVRFAIRSARIVGGTVQNHDEAIQQNLTASAGQIWSFSVQMTNKGAAPGDGVYRAYVRWLDSTSALISEVAWSLPSLSTGRWEELRLDAETAPANTAFAQIRFIHECTPVGGCAGNTFKYLLDGAMACVCAVAPTFGDSSNLLSNPSFENVFSGSGTWISATINPGAQDVVAATVAWTANVPPDTTLLVESSIDGQATFQTVSINGGAIPGISIGDDLSSTDINIRLTLSTTDARVASAVALLVVEVVDQSDETLKYELLGTPGVTIEDSSDNSNTGTMSYPVQATGLFSSATPLKTTRTVLARSAAVGSPDFASAAPGDPADVNLFGEDSGSFIPGGEAVGEAFSNVGFPVTAVWVVLTMVLGILLGGVTWKATEGNWIFTSSMLALTLVVASWIGEGLIPGWSVITGILILVVVNVTKRGLAV